MSHPESLDRQLFSCDKEWQRDGIGLHDTVMGFRLGVQGAGFELSTLAEFQFRDFSTELNSFTLSSPTK
jgi:hypothetical protein